ncbi:LON peptidase substrate-binding domain-containing protein [Pseudomonas aeruginosa]|nr:LON peptidase substrate-binding domain-containing protein [Pseudomonas aeruginosa]
MKTLVELPLLPLRDVVVYPHMVIPLFVGREKSIEALEAAMTGDKQILLLAQKTPRTTIRAKMACTAWVRSPPCCSCSLPDGTVKVLVEGEQRGQVERFIEEEGHIRAAVQAIDDANVGEREAEVFTAAC